MDLVGQPRALRLLTRAIGAPGHAYLFTGPEGVGKRHAALGLASALLCRQGGCGACEDCRLAASGNHPDIRVWDLPEGEKTFKVERVRELIATLAYQPYRGHRQVHVLAAFDAIQGAGANALLKSLEEPPASATLILLARDLELVLPTIVSRCQLVPFGLIAPPVIETELSRRHPAIAPEAARELAFQAQGRLGRALAQVASPPPPPRPPERPSASWAEAIAARPEPEQSAALDALLLWCRDLALRIVGDTESPLRHRLEELEAALGEAPLDTWLRRAARIERAREELSRYVSAKLVFEALSRDWDA